MYVKMDYKCAELATVKSVLQMSSVVPLYLLYYHIVTQKHTECLYIGIEFYLFVSHGGMKERGSMCKFRNARISTRGSYVFHNTMRNKQVEFNPYIHNFFQNCPVLAMKYLFYM